MTTQLPSGVHQAAKVWIQSKGEEFTELDGPNLTSKFGNYSLLKGFPLHKGIAIGVLRRLLKSNPF